jgi:hypothetical protein
MAFAQLMNSTMGRILRIVAGTAMILLGIFGLGGATGIVVAALGVIPLGAGIFDVCLMAPILSVPWSGKRIRAMK